MQPYEVLASRICLPRNHADAGRWYVEYIILTNSISEGTVVDTEPEAYGVLDDSKKARQNAKYRGQGPNKGEDGGPVKP